MTDWITKNKGAGPWPFEKQPNKPHYNEAIRIEDSPRIGGNSVWNMTNKDFGGIPITSIHDPWCGYWTKGGIGGGGGGGGGGTKGYIMGGDTTLNHILIAAIQDLIFSNETSHTIAANLVTAKAYGAGVNNSSKGYIIGGRINSGINGIGQNVIESLIFSNEISQIVNATLNIARDNGAGVNSNTKGYIMGGTPDFHGVCLDGIEDLIFSNETSQSITATLDLARYASAGVNNSSKGYIMGGIVFSTDTNVIEDLIFNNETSQTIAATLNIAKSYGTGVNSTDKGYLMGGHRGAPYLTYLSEIESLIFSNETSQLIGAHLSAVKSLAAGVNSSSKGYAMGGWAESQTNMIESLIFNNEVSQQILTALLDPPMSGSAGVQNSSL